MHSEVQLHLFIIARFYAAPNKTELRESFYSHPRRLYPTIVKLGHTSITAPVLFPLL